MTPKELLGSLFNCFLLTVESRIAISHSIPFSKLCQTIL